MIATLPMYDLPEARESTDRLWQAWAARLREAGVADLPGALERERWSEALLAPDLLLGQTCGYPLTHALAGRVRYVATPCYTAPGCTGGFYRSAFVVRTGHPATRLEDLRGGVFAYNGRDSQSGWNAPRLALARIAGGAPMFSATLETGAHHASLVAVAGRQADLCAVDAISLALLRRHRPAACEGLRVLGWTDPAPGLPYVTRLDATDAEVTRLRAALRSVLDDDGLDQTRTALLLAGMEVLPVGVYQRIVDMETEAAALGFVEIA